MTRPAPRSNLRKAWLLGLVAASPIVAWSFTITNHSRITREALREIVRRPTATSPPSTEYVYRFTNEAAVQIASANVGVDASSLGGTAFWASGAPHFDDDHLGSAAIVNDARTRLFLMLVSVRTADNATLRARAYDARDLLGETLHTLQDFYAHSNYVELGNDRPVAFGSMPAGGHNVDNACMSSGTVPIGIHLLTGFYSDQSTHAAAEQCVHGKTVPFTSIVLRPGMAKDERAVAVSPGNFDQARELAKRATNGFVQDLIVQLEAANASRSICALLGQPQCEMRTATASGTAVYDNYFSSMPLGQPTQFHLNQTQTLPYPAFARPDPLLGTTTALRLTFTATAYCPPKPDALTLPVGATYRCRALSDSDGLVSTNSVLNCDGGPNPVTCHSAVSLGIDEEFDAGTAHVINKQVEVTRTLLLNPAGSTATYYRNLPGQIDVTLEQRFRIYPFVRYSDGSSGSFISDAGTTLDSPVSTLSFDQNYLYAPQ